MVELVVIGPEPQQHWRRLLIEGRTIRIGRKPKQGWAVPWDLRISREQADLLLEGRRMYVRCLPSARNAAHCNNESVNEFSITVGEHFRIGKTTFRLEPQKEKSELEKEKEELASAGTVQDEPTMMDYLTKNQAENIRDQLIENSEQQIASLGGAAANDDETEILEQDDNIDSSKNEEAGVKKDSTFDPALESFAKKSWVQALRAKILNEESWQGVASIKRPSSFDLPITSEGDGSTAKEKIRRLIWGRLPQQVRQDIQDLAAAKPAGDAAKMAIIDALNQLSQDRRFLAATGIAVEFDHQAKSAEIDVLAGRQKQDLSQWTDLQVRISGRLLLQTLFPQGLQLWQWDADRLVLLGTLSRGEPFGQKELLLNQPYSETYIAGGTSEEEDAAIPAPVELIRIPATIFQQLLTISEHFRATIGKLSE